MKLDELAWEPYPNYRTSSIWTSVAAGPAGSKIYWSEELRVYTVWIGLPDRYLRYLDALMAQCVLHALATDPSSVKPDIGMKDIPREVI